MKILLVEDETDVRDLILLHLQRDRFDVEAVADGEAALKLLETRSYDLAILDWMLPGVSGLEICKKLQGGIPVLMVTARSEAVDIVRGLEAGADDYVVKPFEIPVLMARVRALLRRGKARGETQSADLSAGEIRLNTETYQVTCAGEETQLTPSEFKLLKTLMMNQDRVFTRDRLIEAVQGQGITVTDRAIDTHVFSLRKKLGKCADTVETIRGVGYRVKSSG